MMQSELDSILSPTGASGNSAIAGSAEALSLRTRYTDGYRAAVFVIVVGTIVKVLAFVVAGLMVLADVVALANATHGSVGNALSPVTLIEIGILLLAAVTWLLIFAFGVFISAQGQLLRATLDGAVNSSPFLNNSDRAAIMRV